MDKKRFAWEAPIDFVSTVSGVTLKDAPGFEKAPEVTGQRSGGLAKLE